jgi:DnaK suppressor protein
MPNKKPVRVNAKRPERKPNRSKGKSIKKSTPTSGQDSREESHSSKGMNRQIIEEITQDLSRRRSSLLQNVAESQDEMKAIFEQQESELEESAQKDRMARLTSRLNDRDQQKIREINAALDRIDAGIYGKCEGCGQEIGVARLRALPTATLCIKCAAEREATHGKGESGEPSEYLPLRGPEAEEPGEEGGVKEDEK